MSVRMLPAKNCGKTWLSSMKTFEMTFNGHFGGDGAGYLASTSNAGNRVHQMFLNTQFETHGGNGWIRILEFLQDGKTVRVRTYSPFLDLYRTSGDFAFQFQLTPIDFLDGDFNRDGVVDTADYVVWRDTAGTFGYYAADANGDNMIDQADYAVWRATTAERVGLGRSVGRGSGTIRCCIVVARLCGCWCRTPSPPLNVRAASLVPKLARGYSGENTSLARRWS